MNKVTRKQKTELRKLATLRDTEIDLSDQPEVRDWSRAVVGKFYRPIKKSLTIRLDADVLAWLKGQGARLSDSHQQASALGDGESIEAKESLAVRAG
jgi:uncharacterized protein (DUF4415 family)